MKKKGSFLKSIYFSMILFVCIGAMLPCATISVVVAGYIKNISIQQSEKQMGQMIDTMLSLISEGENFAIEVFHDKDIVPLLFGENPASNEIMRAMNRLNSYLKSNENVESIYVYNRELDYVYSTLSEGRSSRETFGDTEINQFLQGELEWGKLELIPRVLYGNTNIFTIVYHEGINWKTGQYDNVVIVNLKQTALDTYFLKRGKSSQEDIFILSSEGELLTSYSSLPLYSDLSGEPYVQKIFQSVETEGNLTEKIGNEEFLVQYKRMKELGDWIFLDIVNYSSLKRPIINITLCILGIVICTSILISILAYKISLRIYRPIESMEKRFHELRKAYKKSGFVIRNTAFQNFVFYGGIKDRKTIEEIVEKNNLNFIIQSNTKLIHIIRENDICGESAFEKCDQELLWFTICNICDEIGNMWNPSITVATQENHYVLLMNMETEYSDDFLEQNIAAEIQKNIFQICNYHVKIVLAETLEDAGMLHTVYRNVYEYEKYFLLFGKEIINYQDIVYRQEMDVEYPKAMLEAYNAYFLAGKKAQADQICRELIEEAALYTYGHFKYIIDNMCYSLWNILEKSENYIKETNSGQNDMIKRIQQADCLQEIVREFEKLNGTMADCINEKSSEDRQKNQDIIIEKIDELIEKNYSDMNLNIQMIAEKMQMSSAYLGRLYNKRKGTSITKVITEVRLSNSCKLLMDDVSVQRITEQCGFCNVSYFYRLFKKHYGITPNVYRTQGQSEKKS